MKVKYIGETFYDGMGLTNNKVYECVDIDKENQLLEIIDDEGEEYLYTIINPKPVDGSSNGGEWEIVEDPKGILKNIFDKAKNKVK